MGQRTITSLVDQGADACRQECGGNSLAHLAQVFVWNLLRNEEFSQKRQEAF